MTALHIKLGPLHSVVYRLFLTSVHKGSGETLEDLGMYPQGGTDLSDCWLYIDAILDYRYLFDSRTFVLEARYAPLKNGRLDVYVEGVSGIFTRMYGGYEKGHIAMVYDEQDAWINPPIDPNNPPPDPTQPDANGNPTVTRFPYSLEMYAYFLKHLNDYVGSPILPT